MLFDTLARIGPCTQDIQLRTKVFQVRIKEANACRCSTGCTHNGADLAESPWRGGRAGYRWCVHEPWSIKQLFSFWGPACVIVTHQTCSTKLSAKSASRERRVSSTTTHQFRLASNSRVCNTISYYRGPIVRRFCPASKRSRLGWSDEDACLQNFNSPTQQVFNLS